jgi:hypothetical protein
MKMKHLLECTGLEREYIIELLQQLVVLAHRFIKLPDITLS